jgi:tetratricopeptide (TPR) repeat protein
LLSGNPFRQVSLNRKRNNCYIQAMNFVRPIPAFILLCCFTLHSFGQNKKTDSLLLVAKTAKHDTSKYNALIQLGSIYRNINTDSAIFYHDQAKTLAERMDDETRKGKAIVFTGWDNYLTGNYTIALKLYIETLRLADNSLKKSKDKTIIERAWKLKAVSLSNIGLIKSDEGKNEEALKYYAKALKINEDIGNKPGKAVNLGNMGLAYANMSEYAKAIEYYSGALKMDEALGNKNGVIRHLSNMGNVYHSQSNLDKTLEYYLKALKISEEIGDNRGKANCLDYLGSVYRFHSDHSKALEYFFKALKIDEELSNKKGIARHLLNIGSSYQAQGEYKKALEYFSRSLIIYRELGDKANEAGCLGGLGLVYLDKSQYTKSLEYYFQSLKIEEEIKNKHGYAWTCGNIGVVYRNQGDSALQNGNKKFTEEIKYPLALEYFLKALKMYEELEDKDGIERNLANIGSAYVFLRKYREGEKYLDRAYKLVLTTGSVSGRKFIHQSFKELYEQTGRPDQALKHYKLFIQYRDSIRSEENTKASIQQEMQFMYEKKSAADSVKIAEQKKIVKAKLEASAASLKQEKTQRFALYGGLLLVLVFAGFMFNRFKVTQKQKKVIELKEAETQKQNEIISHQKELVEEKQKEILDSIYYARRIQRALITNEMYIERNLNKLKKG